MHEPSSSVSSWFSDGCDGFVGALRDHGGWPAELEEINRLGRPAAPVIDWNGGSPAPVSSFGRSNTTIVMLSDDADVGIDAHEFTCRSRFGRHRAGGAVHFARRRSRLCWV